MLRLLIYSRDPALHSAGLGAEFLLAIDSDRERTRDLVVRRKCDVVIVDFECRPANEQFEFMEELRKLGMPVVVVANDDSAARMELMRRGVRNCVSRPLAMAELSIVVRRAHEYAVLEREAEDGAVEPSAGASCGGLVGSSAGAQVVYDLIRRVAGLNAFVLITGESGTGKELIARAIHSLSDRRSGPFVAVSCGAIPEPLIEAELFGSEKGAFTGAAARRTGYFEEAGEGTLLLDEIGELSAHTQVKLLRVLQQREFMRLGSGTAIPLKARVLFATNRNLKQMVAEGAFREDLYYRVNVVGIQSQPLRDRREDIPSLARHFLAGYARTYRKAVTSIEPEALALLSEYPWPGNVRELENVIQSAIILTDDDAIHPSNLPEEMQQAGPARLPDALQWSSFEARLRDYKTKLALDAIKECNGNKTLAAQSLNISRTYLHRLIREPGEEGHALQVA
jgi:DNA-binding NtrC family response regulator